MNVFIVPSWYPTNAQPLNGIFNQEQALAMAHTFPDSCFAISTWGSHDPELQLWAREPLKNLAKLAKFPFKKPGERLLATNLQEYYSPALTWTRTFLAGNINTITRQCEQHLQYFTSERGKADLIHAHTAFPGGWIAMKLSQKQNIPYVITEHMSPFPFPAFQTKTGTPNHWLMQPMQGAFANIAVSPQQKEKLSNWKIPGLRYIPNLVNEDFFMPAPQDPATSGKPFTFFTLARMDAQKGIPYLLQAFHQVLKQQSNCRLRIGGDGPDKESYQDLARKMGIDQQITWLGLLNRQQSLVEYQQCHAFVLPSLHENLPLVLLEALACGKPLISTRCGGPESIIHHENGFLVAPADSRQLAQAMQRLMANIAAYDQVKIREDFCIRYSREVVCRQIMQVYQEAIALKTT